MGPVDQTVLLHWHVAPSEASRMRRLTHSTRSVRSPPPTAAPSTNPRRSNMYMVLMQTTTAGIRDRRRPQAFLMFDIDLKV